MSEDKGNVGIRFLVSAACLGVIVWALQEAAAVLVPFVLALFLSLVGMPGVFWLRKRRVPTGLAILIVLLVLFGFLTGVGALVGGSLTQFTAKIPEYQAKLSTWRDPINAFLLEQDLPQLGDSLKLINPGFFLSFVGDTLSTLARFVSNLIFVLLTMVFLLAEGAHFPEKLRAALGHSGDLSRFAKIGQQVKDYIVIKTLVSLVTGVIVGTWVWIWGVDFPFLWGLLGFLLNYIPNLGSIIAAIPPVFLAAIDDEGGLATALIVASGYVAVNMVLGNIVEPKLMGKRLGLSSLVVFLSLAFWAWVWGGVGMLLSVPLTMIVKIMLENSDDFRWIAVLLGPSVEPKTEDVPAEAS